LNSAEVWAQRNQEGRESEEMKNEAMEGEEE